MTGHIARLMDEAKANFARSTAKAERERLLFGADLRRHLADAVEDAVAVDPSIHFGGFGVVVEILLEIPDLLGDDAATMDDDVESLRDVVLRTLRNRLAGMLSRLVADAGRARDAKMDASDIVEALRAVDDGFATAEAARAYKENVDDAKSQFHKQAKTSLSNQDVPAFSLALRIAMDFLQIQLPRLDRKKFAPVPLAAAQNAVMWASESPDSFTRSMGRVRFDELALSR